MIRYICMHNYFPVPNFCMSKLFVTVWCVLEVSDWPMASHPAKGLDSKVAWVLLAKSNYVVIFTSVLSPSPSSTQANGCITDPRSRERDSVVRVTLLFSSLILRMMQNQHTLIMSLKISPRSHISVPFFYVNLLFTTLTLFLSSTHETSARWAGDCPDSPLSLQITTAMVHNDGNTFDIYTVVRCFYLLWSNSAFKYNIY